jgi:polyhydroxyalkanoate synthesis repressor PhaR
LRSIAVWCSLPSADGNSRPFHPGRLLHRSNGILPIWLFPGIFRKISLYRLRAPQYLGVDSYPMSAERLIKKYANRRLYDASQSRHITLDDIRELIVKGEKIKVVEDKTGKDLTRHILLQVIAEQEQFGRPVLSTTVLESIIRLYGNSTQGLLASFLERSVETFLMQQEAMQSQISKMVANTPLASMSDLTRANLEAMAKLQESMFSALMPKRDKGRDED